MKNRVRTTKIKEALNQHKVRAIKTLVKGLGGDTETTKEQLEAATNILLILQGEGDE